MELLQLQYFERVARYENMTKAAKELCVAQSAVSQSIARLEEDLGVRLFLREGKRLKLSPCGVLLCSRFPSVLGTLDTLRLELSELADTPVRQLRLNILSASMLVPGLLRAFREAYPHIRFRLTQDPKETDYDLRITSGPADTPGRGTALLSEEILLAVPQSFAQAEKSTVSLFDLRGGDFISLSRGTAFRAITDAYCASAGFAPNVSFESDNPAMVRDLVGAGVGVTFWPSISWGPLGGRAKALHVVEADFRRVITIAPPQEKSLSKTARLFVSFTADFFQSL